MNEAPNWMIIAAQEKGVSEIVGLEANKRIVEYASETSLHATSDEVPWCSSFVNWCMKKSLIKGTNSAAARSWLEWGYKCEPRTGCVVVLQRGNDGISGHVGFLVEHDQAFVHLLGGNQGDSVCVQKFPRHKVIDFRWPFHVQG